MLNRKFKFGVLVLLSATIFSTNSFAWGDREQAALWGVTGGIILGNIINGQPQYQPYNRVYVERRYYNEPVYIDRYYNNYYNPYNYPPRIYIERPHHHHYYDRDRYYYGR